MKQSSKKRKLEYIREKNHYRLGGSGVGYFKVSGQLIEDVDFVKLMLDTQTAETLNSFQKKFKMEFKAISYESGLIGDDFINNVTTFKIKFKKV